MKHIIILGLFIVIAGVVMALPNKVEASYHHDLRHAYQPTTIQSGDQKGWMKARVDNFAVVDQTRLVCVEAFNQATNRKTHLGCLSVSSGANEFNAPTHWLRPGWYRVVYTYQATNGSWHRILSTNLRIQDGWYRAY